jgi:hypothetical protein
MNNKCGASSVLVLDEKIKPLVVRSGVGIWPNIQMILIILLDSVLQIAALEVGLKTQAIQALSL